MPGGTVKGRRRPKRIQLMLPPEHLNAVDDFRFQNRMPSRAAAVRELMTRGLDVPEEASASASPKPKRH